MINTIGVAPSYKIFEENLETLNFEKAIKDKEKPVIELQRIYEICHYGYILDSGTLIHNLKREEVIEPEELLNELPNQLIKEPDIEELYELLCLEIQEYIGNNNKIGILLSGGLDSRILAGVLKSIQNKKGYDFQVTAYSWGIENSRDLKYSEEICKRYQWEFIPIYQNEDTLLENIKLGIKVGAEAHPVNFHSMQYIIDNNNVDIFLAGSYGDSVGRGEYDGKRIEVAPTMAEKTKNRLHIFNNDFEKKCNSNIIRHNQAYYKKYQNQKHKHLVKEIDYLKNHHTKYLAISMSLISIEKPLFQLFTHTRTLKYLFSLDLSVRYDNLYKELLVLLPNEIGYIPWARTGKSFIQTEETVDDFLPNHHMYANWFYQKRFDIVNMIDIDMIETLGIFNRDILHYMIETCKNQEFKTLNNVIRTIIWLASFSYMMNHLPKIHTEKFNSKTSLKNYINFITFKGKVRLMKKAKK